jgi:hypothetical protein
MRFKTLLLGTAAAMAVGGAAQAADLAVAESVEYVKVCDAYGAGYFYIPGSDVCLKIGGYVLMDTFFYGDSQSLNFPTASDDYVASWKFYTETELNATAKWMTDWGAATAFMAIRTQRDPASFYGTHGGTVDPITPAFSTGGDGGLAWVDTAWLKIGGLKAGWDASTFDGGKFHGLYGWESPFDHDRHQQQLQWSTTLGGIGAFFAVEDPRDNTGGSAYYTGDMPDIVAALAGSTGNFSWRWSAAATDTVFGTGWGTEVDVAYSDGRGIEGGNFLAVQAAVGNDAGAGYAANWAPNGNGGTPWHVTAQGGIAWTQAFSTILAVSYRAQGGVNEWEASAEADWALAKGVEAGLAYSHDDPNSSGSTDTVVARIKASF